MNTMRRLPTTLATAAALLALAAPAGAASGGWSPTRGFTAGGDELDGPTNRDLRTAGRYAIFTWARDGRVRVAVRDFGA